MNTFTAKRNGTCAVSGKAIVIGETMIGYRDNQVVLAEYAGPTSKALRSAAHLKAQQRTTPEQWVEFRGEPEPLWMSATVEQIAIHIDTVESMARKHGVQLKWEHIEYGSTPEQIEAAAIAKQNYKYAVGDYLPREARRIATVGGLCVREYFGVFHIDSGDCVVGTYADEYGDIRTTTNNLTRHDIVAIRYSGEAEATAAALAVNQRPI